MKSRLRFPFSTPTPLKIGAIYLISSAFLFSIMAACIKILGERIGSLELTFFRNFITILLLLLSFYAIPLKKTSAQGKPLTLFYRGLFGATALMAYFYNITQIPLATAFVLSQTTPIFIALMSMLFLKTRVQPLSWLAIFLGFMGVIALYPPYLEHFSLIAITLGLYSGLGSALAYLSIAELKGIYEERIIILSLSIAGVILPLMLTPFAESLNQPPIVNPNLTEWGLIFVMGISSTLAQYYLTKAYSIAPSTFLAPLGYINIIFVLLWGTLLGDSLPTLIGIIGIGLIILGGYLSIKSGK